MWIYLFSRLLIPVSIRIKYFIIYAINMAALIFSASAESVL